MYTRYWTRSIQYRAFALVDKTQFIIHDANEAFARGIFFFVAWRPRIAALTDALALEDGSWQVTKRALVLFLKLMFYYVQLEVSMDHIALGCQLFR